jgi:hypothetical protein
MKPESRIFPCCLILLASLSLCLAHDNITVHQMISESAANSSVGLQNFLANGFGYGLEGTKLDFSDPEAKKRGQSPIEWIKDGSRCEDVPSTRGKDHFYDPVHYDNSHHHIGLTDGVDDWGQPSFIKGSVQAICNY